MSFRPNRSRRRPSCDLVNAESTWRTAEMTFKRLIAGGTDDDVFKATINPTDTPSVAQQSVDLAGAVSGALSKRTDLASARKSIESAALDIELLKNQVLPDLNLLGGYSVSGAGGNRVDFKRHGQDRSRLLRLDHW